MKYQEMRNYLATKVLRKFYSRLYSAFAISKQNIKKMVEYLGYPDEAFEEVHSYMQEHIQNKTIPKLEKYKDGAYFVGGYSVSGKTVFDEPVLIHQIITHERLTDFSLPRELRSFGEAVAFLVFDDWADQIVAGWDKQDTITSEVLTQVGKPADVIAQHKLSQLQKEILINIRQNAIGKFPHFPPDFVKVPWNSTELAPSTFRTHASRCLRELKKRGLLILHGSPRTSHVQLTPVATALIERLNETGNND